MDCKEFDEQVVRLDSIEKEAEHFVRVRLTEIDDLDLRLFEFDHDLTYAVFFMDAELGIYGRYGGRDAQSAEGRQSLAGLRSAMLAALERHRGKLGPVPVLRAREDRAAFRLVREYPGVRKRGGCFHCHQLKEVMIDHLRSKGEWKREMAWRYPLPDKLGFSLDVDCGNVVASVLAGSPAKELGLAEGDVVEMLGGAVVESLADAQYGLDHAPWEGETEVVWRRGAETGPRRGALKLKAGWKRSNLLWRTSLINLVPVLDLDGEKLPAAERRDLGVAEDALAFKVRGFIYPALHHAGVRAGDVIIGIGAEQAFDLDSEGIDAFVGSRYQRGDKVEFRVIRGAERKVFEVRFGAGTADTE